MQEGDDTKNGNKHNPYGASRLCPVHEGVQSRATQVVQAPAKVVDEVEEDIGEDKDDGLVDVNEAAWGCGHCQVQKDVKGGHDMSIDADLVQRLVAPVREHHDPVAQSDEQVHRAHDVGQHPRHLHQPRHRWVHHVTVISYLLEVQYYIHGLEGSIHRQCPDAPVGEVGREVDLEARRCVVAHGTHPRPHRPHGEVQRPEQPVAQVQA